jgi:hypothetical protein
MANGTVTQSNDNSVVVEIKNSAPDANPAAKWTDERLQKLAEAIVFHRAEMKRMQAPLVVRTHNVIAWPKTIMHRETGV